MNQQHEADREARALKAEARAALEAAVLRGWRANPESVEGLARRLGVSRIQVRRVLAAHGQPIPRRGGRKAV